MSPDLHMAKFPRTELADAFIRAVYVVFAHTLVIRVAGDLERFKRPL